VSLVRMFPQKPSVAQASDRLSRGRPARAAAGTAALRTCCV
jgi:hypothetical protein